MIELAYYLINRIEGEKRLANPPRDWAATTLQLTRDVERHGILGTTGGDLEFVGDGAEYLINVIDAQGTEADVGLAVYMIDPETELWTRLHSARVNLANYQKKRYDEGAWGVKVNTDLSGFGQRLITYDDTPVELSRRTGIGGEALPAFGFDPAQVWLRPQGVLQFYDAYVDANSPIYTFPGINNSNLRSGNIYLGFNDVVKNELDAFTYNTGVLTDDEELPFIEFTVGAEIEVEVVLNYDFWADRNNGDFDTAELWHWFGLNNPKQFELWHLYDGNAGGTWRRTVGVNRTFSFTVVPGDKLYCFGRIELRDVSGNYSFTYNIDAQPSCRLYVRALTKKAETSCNGYFAHEALARTLGVITGAGNPLYSEYLGRTDSSPQAYENDGPGGLLFITSGAYIRALLSKGLYVTFADLWRALWSVWGLGLGVETLPDGRQRARVEPIAFFYQPDAVLKLGGTVTDFVEEPYEAWRIHQVTTGFKKWKGQAAGISDEFNGSITRTTPTTQHKKSLDILSPYPAAGTLIELHRRKPIVYGEDGVEEESEDDDNFLICVERAAVGTAGLFRWQSEGGEGFTLIEGITAPSTVYNARITPTRNLFRHGEVIAAGLVRQRLLSLTTAKVDGNGNFKSQLPDEAAPLQEKAEVAVAALGAPFAEATKYTFKAPLSWRQWAALVAAPYGVVTFAVAGDAYAGDAYAGYILDAKYKPSDQSASFTLLKTA